MNRRMNSWLVAALVCGLSLSVTSCKDDDDKGGDYVVTPITLTIDNDLKTFGVETDVESAIVKVPVKCDGGWVAYLTDDPDWVAVEGRQVIFEGNQTLSLRFDENRTRADRATTLKIVTDNGDMTLIPVRQTQKYRGEDVRNDNSQWFGNNGLGLGYNFAYVFEGDTAKKHQQEFNPNAMCMTNPIFNWTKIEELQQTWDSIKGDYVLSKSAYAEIARQNIEYRDIPRDSTVYNADSLGISIDLQMGFGFMEFEGHGEYHASETKGSAKLNYLFDRTATVYDAFISPAELKTVANRIGGVLDTDLMNKQMEAIEKKEANWKLMNQKKYLIYKKKGKTPDGTPVTDEMVSGDYLEPWQDEAIAKAIDELDLPDYGGIFSEGFGKIYYRLTRYTENHDTKRFEAAMEDLDANWGPLFVARGWYGGNILMRVLVDTTYLDTQGRFKGYVKGGMDNMFNIDLTVEINYYEQATRIVRNGDAFIKVYGGDAVICGNKLSAHFNSESMTDRDDLLSILQDWGDSLMEGIDENGNTEAPKPIMQKAQLIGIWTLFDDVETAQAVHEWMDKKHPLLKNYVGTLIE